MCGLGERRRPGPTTASPGPVATAWIIFFEAGLTTLKVSPSAGAGHGLGLQRQRDAVGLVGDGDHLARLDDLGRGDVARRPPRRLRAAAAWRPCRSPRRRRAARRPARRRPCPRPGPRAGRSRRPRGCGRRSAPSRCRARRPAGAAGASARAIDPAQALRRWPSPGRARGRRICTAPASSTTLAPGAAVATTTRDGRAGAVEQVAQGDRPSASATSAAQRRPAGRPKAGGGRPARAAQRAARRQRRCMAS